MKTRKHLKALTIICLLSIQSLFAQAPVLGWAIQIGGTLNDLNRSIALDAAGNIYTTGYFEGTVDFDPGMGTANLTSVGDRDIFVQKLDTNGNFIWAKQMGGTASGLGFSIAVDALGNVYTTGRFAGTVDFDPGMETVLLTSTGGSDIFVQKLDSNGNFLWAKQMGGTSFDAGNSIAVDVYGNVYTTGSFHETTDFDPGAETANLTSAGNDDIFVQKLDTDGNFLWARQMGGPSYDNGNSIAVDTYGNVYSSGSFHETADFDQGAVNLISVGYKDIFIQKLDTDGDFLWAKRMGGIYNDYAFSMAVDASENVYTTGKFEETVDFDPGVETVNLTSAGYDDIFIQKLAGNGNFLWAKRMGGASDEHGLSITFDAAGNVYTAGEFKGTADFDPGEGTYNLTSAGGYDIFIQKLDANGDFLWAERFGGASTDNGSSITVDTSGNIYTTGRFEETVDFDPGAGMENLTSAGGFDIFIQKLSPCYLIAPVPNVISLPDLTDECSVYPTAPTAINGCGTTFIGSTTTTFPITAQGTTVVVWTYDDGSGNVLTQDQNVIIADMTAPVPDIPDLAFLFATCEIIAFDAPTATDNCEGAITASTNLTFPITDPSITQIVWTYDDGSGNVTTQNQTINWTTVDVTTSLTGLTITANNANGSYQWLDCDNNHTPLPGETNQSFTASANGNYAVEITENGCVGTSACVSITTVGLSEFKQNVRLRVYPNPSSDIFTIEFEKAVKNVVLTLTDSQGKLISITKIQNADKGSIEIKEAPGIYLLTIQSKEGQKTIQLIKE